MLQIKSKSKAKNNLQLYREYTKGEHTLQSSVQPHVQCCLIAAEYRYSVFSDYFFLIHRNDAKSHTFQSPKQMTTEISSLKTRPFLTISSRMRVDLPDLYPVTCIYVSWSPDSVKVDLEFFKQL